MAYGAVAKEEPSADRAIELPIDDGKPTIRDPIFALLFLAHFVGIWYIGWKYASYGHAAEQGSDIVSTFDNDNFILYFLLPCVGIALVVALIMFLYILPAAPEMVIKGGLIFSILAAISLGVAFSIYLAHWYLYVFTALIVLVLLWFVYMIWDYIPFAAVNLKAALLGMGDNLGTYMIGLLSTIILVAWLILWFYVFDGFWGAKQEGKAKDFYGIAILLILSLFWTMEVIFNSVQVTVAGVMGTWCCDKNDADSFCSNAVTSSFLRSWTYSLGSICFGSLLEAIMKTLQYLVQKGKQYADSDGNKCDLDSLFFGCLQCIVNCCGGILEYFNEWTYIYIGIYGYGYLESGKKVMRLFASRGWTALVANKLVQYLLNVACVLIGVITGLIAIPLGETVDIDDHRKSFFIGFVIAVVISTVMMYVVKGAVNTVIVCYASTPTLLANNHPDLTKEIAEAWLLVFPDCGVEVPIIEAQIV